MTYTAKDFIEDFKKEQFIDVLHVDVARSDFATMVYIRVVAETDEVMRLRSIFLVFEREWKEEYLSGLAADGLGGVCPLEKRDAVAVLNVILEDVPIRSFVSTHTIGKLIAIQHAVKSGWASDNPAIEAFTDLHRWAKEVGIPFEENKEA